ncbi:MAG TPA: hypothetical protein VG755_33045 [Nannocystaceae bacterium]|nr:hypothetical protein [Nannocystaceae bacterium]
MLSWIVLAALAPADVQVVVVPPAASQLPADRRALVLDTVEGALATAGIVVVERAQVTTALQRGGADCASDVACRDRVATELGARFVVTMTVAEPKDSDYAIHLEVQEVGASDTLATFDEMCTICSEADLGRVLRERTLDARAAIQRKLAPDDDEREVVPPPVVERPVATPVRVDVVRPSKLTLAGWGLVGAGAAGTIGGVVLLALQGSRAGCPADPRGGPCIPLVYRTVAPGVATLVTGLALAGTGIGLVIAGKRRDAKRRAAHVTPTVGGVVARF